MTTVDPPAPPPPAATWFRRLRTASLAAIVANVGIVLTGGIVRVTGSGLGCPDWPACDGTSIVPRGGTEAAWHQAIEFGNRTLTGVLLAVAIWVVVAHRRDLAELRHAGIGPDGRAATRLRWLVRLQPIGILAQAVLGGVTVLTDLNPVVVATHFVLSMVLIGGAVALRHEVVPRARDRASGLALPARAVAGTAGVVLVLGTIVTAAGPHAGDPGTPRLGIDIRTAALAHADAVWLLVGLTVALLLAAVALEEPRVRRAVGVLLVVELLQGGIGYTQYALGIPPELVSLHLLGAALVWVAAVRVALVDREPIAPAPPAPPRSPQQSHVTVTA